MCSRNTGCTDFCCYRAVLYQPTDESRAFEEDIGMISLISTKIELAAIVVIDSLVSMLTDCFTYQMCPWPYASSY